MTHSNSLKNCHQQAWHTALSQLSPINSSASFAFILVTETANDTGLQQSLTKWFATQAICAVNVDDYDNCHTESDRIKNIFSKVDKIHDRITNISIIRYIICSDDSTATQSTLQNKLTGLNNILTSQHFDCHLLPIEQLLQEHKIAFFDMDSTLIEQEVIVEVAKAIGIGEQINTITESAMRGDIDFNQSFTERVGLLQGTHADMLDTISDSLTISAGAHTTIAVLHGLGYYTVLLSGGFSFFAKHIAEQLGLNEYHANELVIKNNMVTGEVTLPILDGQRKADLVKQIATEQNVPLDEVICIGDGANDLNMMAIANIGIAYQAKPIVQQQADLAINTTGLEGVLYALGHSKLM